MPALALQTEPQAQAPWMTERPSEYGRSCGRSKYFRSFQLLCVPRKVFMSNSTSSPSAANSPSCIATKSFRPMPFGATVTWIAIGNLPSSGLQLFLIFVTRTLLRNASGSRRAGPFGTRTTMREYSNGGAHRSEATTPASSRRGPRRGAIGPDRVLHLEGPGSRWRRAGAEGPRRGDERRAREGASLSDEPAPRRALFAEPRPQPLSDR